MTEKIINNGLNEKHNIDNILQKLNINNKIINDINKILNTENENIPDNFFNILKELQNNIKKIYEKFGNSPENKEKILEYLFNNLNFLFKNIKIARLFNTGTILDISTFKNNDIIQQSQSLFYTKKSDINIQKVLGGSCNYFIVWFYYLLLDIFNEDIECKFELTYYGNKIKKILPGSGNHGKMYFNIKGGTKEYLAENREKLFYFGKTDNKKIEGKKFDNIDDYIKNFKINENKREKYSFHLGKQGFLLFKIKNFYIFKYENDDEKKINFFLFNGNSSENLKRKILEKIGNSKEKNSFIDLFFNKNKIIETVKKI